MKCKRKKTDSVLDYVLLTTHSFGQMLFSAYCMCKTELCAAICKMRLLPLAFNMSLQSN